MVVTVTPEDFAKEGFQGGFAGVDFQRQRETRAFERGGGSFQAPSLRVTDYVNEDSVKTCPTRHTVEDLTAPLDGIYPDYVDASLREALQVFDRKLLDLSRKRGQAHRRRNANRISHSYPKRDKETLKPCGIEGLYPVGEGMGYGGGIASAALDGIRSAEALLQALGATPEEVVHEPQSDLGRYQTSPSWVSR